MILQIQGSELIARDVIDGTDLDLSALELLSLLRAGGCEIFGTNGSQIGFSSIPLALKVKVQNVDGIVRAQLYGSNGFDEVPIRQNQAGAILGNMWYPLNSNSLDEVKAWYLLIGVSSLGPLTMSDILAIQKNSSGYAFDVDIDLKAARSVIASGSNPTYALAPGVKLYDYQEDGLKYLFAMQKSNLGCLLADEMGLGKTLQVIALLTATLQTAEYPSLIITPVSLLENWRRELSKFAPQLKFIIRTGSSRSFEPRQFDGFDLVLSNYETVANDDYMYKGLDWNYIILDEAQYIKNPTAKRTLAINTLKKRIGVAVSGTPFENHTTDVWSLANFVLPSYLGELDAFQKNFPDTQNSAEQLRELLEPLVLRRRLRDIEHELPERIDASYFFEPSESMAATQKTLIESTKTGSISLEIITKLRLVAAHSYDSASAEEELLRSQKWQYLRDSLEEIFARNQKALIFSSFNVQSSHLTKLISKEWPSAYVDQIDGSVPAIERLNKIENLSNSKFGALILNPQAAGIGLNITSANHIFHFNPEWNPALTEQSTKRSHRQGQENRVVVHYLFYTGTLEEMIAESQEFKNVLGGILVPENSDILSPASVIERLRSGHASNY